uniref:pyrimidine dimer DNA glycosylase/endonuclease V n=1 Tax=Candidatus Scatocola faecipullorum TaxID=2840917 RepID=UPI004028A1E8
MSLWTVHPKYLDKQGLISLWREGLLAQKVLNGELDVKLSNPIWQQFRQAENPLKAIGSYLSFVAAEGARRGYKFSHEKIIYPNFEDYEISVRPQDLIFEMKHLRDKLKLRDREKWNETSQVEKVEAHPTFRLN